MDVVLLCVACVPCICVGPRLSCVMSHTLSLSSRARPRPPAPRAGACGAKGAGACVCVRVRVTPCAAGAARSHTCASWPRSCQDGHAPPLLTVWASRGAPAQIKAQGHNLIRRYEHTRSLFGQLFCQLQSPLAAALRLCHLAPRSSRRRSRRLSRRRSRRRSRRGRCRRSAMCN